MPDLSATSEDSAKNAIPARWLISQHAFRCGSCDAWVAQGERIARVRLRWWCASCAERVEDQNA